VEKPLRILHVLRAPIGGLFRHVRDLAKGQSALGHEVGIICDSTTGGAYAAAEIAEVEEFCKLGVTRLPMALKPAPGDIACIRATRKLARGLSVDVLHGHGAKGGLYARLAAKSARRGVVYTPHGGSIHYNWHSPVGMIYLATETWLRRSTSGLAFVCDYEREIYDRKIGTGGVPVNIVHNGLWPEEFHRVPPGPDAADILFVGEMVNRKGVDLLLRAIAELKPKLKLTAAMVGDGPELDDYKALAKELGIDGQLSFKGRLGIAQALPMGKLFVLSSRHESFPYVVLEVIAAGRQIISADIGGLKEVLPAELLFAPESVPALVTKLEDVMENATHYQAITDALGADAPRKFSAESMVKSITDFYSRLK
jgi:glycosyltransferase involved in cell wall biosynthesis